MRRSHYVAIANSRGQAPLPDCANELGDKVSNRACDWHLSFLQLVAGVVDLVKGQSADDDGGQRLRSLANEQSNILQGAVQQARREKSETITSMSQ